MNIKTIKFNTKDKPEFFKELHRRVNQHFKDNNISKYANFNMKFKTVFMLCLYFLPLLFMLTGIVHHTWVMFLLWIMMGFGMSGIGLSIMHDANHGSYSRNPKVNNALGFLINFLGGYHVNWKIQHNILHHSFTNVHGMDEDISGSKVMRFSPDQSWKWIYKFQAFYAPFFYMIMTIYWFTGKDFGQVIRYKKKNLLKSQGLTLKTAITQIFIAKVCYVILLLVLPLIQIDLPWWQVVLGFLTMHFICGLVLALIFQPAHVIEETDFYQPDQEGSIENNWAIHQMRTTANFANDSKVFSWFIGGLNYQIEHHLFPHICHVHYKHISKIVRKTAEEFNVPYHYHSTFFGAVKSHFTLLHQLGTGKYDMKMALIKSK